MAGKKMAPVARARLLDKLMQAPRFSLVRAPAGFGKSMLLDQLEARLAAAGKPVVRLASAASAQPPALAADGATVLIDDADQADAALIAKLAGGAGAARLVLAARGDPGLPLARLRAAGEVLDIGPRELLFDAAEQQLVRDGWAGLRLTDRQWDAIVGAIGGWPCGFGLQLQCLESDVAGRSGPAVEGSWRIVADYFEQEVMSALPEELVRFLRDGSVIEDLSVEDCNLLFETSTSAAALTEAHALGAPLWPTDPEHRSYAILPLFREFLRTGLAEEDARRLGARACEKLEASSRFRDACIQALVIGDHERAASLLELQLRADYAFRDGSELVMLAERIDARVRERHPFIVLVLTQVLTFRFEFEKARQHLERARALVAERAKTPDADADEVRTLEMLLLHREMVLALGQHELSRAQELGDRLLQDMEHLPPMQRVMLLNSLTYAQQELYIFRGAERYYAEAKTLIPELDSWISSIPLETFYARHLYQTGRTAAAVDLLESTLARLVAEVGPRPVLGSIAAVVLAEMKFEIGELDEAAELLADYGGNVEQFGFLPMTLMARLVQARLHMVAGEHDQGFAVLERPLVGAGELFERMSRALAVERAYWLLRLGRVEPAKLACGELGLSLVRPPEPHSSAAAVEESYATTWIQLARANKRIDEAIHLAQKWQRYTEGVGAVRSNVQWNVVLAALRVLAEDPTQATRHLRRAVLLGAGGQYRRVFLEEFDVLGDHIARLVGSDLSSLERSFLQSLAEGAPDDEAPERAGEIALPLGAFSSREAAIVRLVAKGLLNREIGDTLGMTEGTVKWYLQRIYDKLGVRRRSQVAILVSQWNTRSIREADALH